MSRSSNVTRVLLYGLLMVSLYSKSLPSQASPLVATSSNGVRSFLPADRHLYFSPSRNLFGTMSGDSKWASFPKKDAAAWEDLETDLIMPKQQKKSLPREMDDSMDNQGILFDDELLYDEPQAQISPPLIMDMSKRFGRVQYRSEGSQGGRWSQSNFVPEGDSSDVLPGSLLGGASSSGKNSAKPNGANTLFKMRLFG